jgi:Fe-S-cluster containining protein
MLPSVSDALRDLLRLHDDVDRRVAPLTREHAQRLHCERGCHACCVDDLSVFEIEAARIRTGHAALLQSGTPHPPGRCAFLGDGLECRIYPDRPYVCRTQGLPLRWLEEDGAGGVRERRDICSLNVDGAPLEALRDEDCWWIGPTELELGALQGRIDHEQRRRIALRSLFNPEAP